jgi:hypothetical protein
MEHGYLGHIQPGSCWPSKSLPPHLPPALDRNFCLEPFDPVQNFLLAKQALLSEQLNQRLELDHVRVAWTQGGRVKIEQHD